MSKKTLWSVLTALTMMLIAVGLHAEVLYDATSLNSSGGVLNATSWPSLDDGLLLLDDITVPDGGWTIDSISCYYSIIGTPVADSAFFILYSNTVENVDPTQYQTAVHVTVALETCVDPSNGQERDAYRITTAELNQVLEPGTYWIGLSPISDSYMTNWMAWG
jgi:hypothetical protein